MDIEKQPWLNERLPVDLIPVHYDLRVFPDFYSDDYATFTGNVSITINLTSTRPVRHLLVHVNQLNITKTRVRSTIQSTPSADDPTANTERRLAVASTFHYAPNEYWVVELERPVVTSSGPKVIVLDMQFEGSMTSGIVGLYRSRYVDSRSGQTRFIATTKFQPTEARRAFPCFDEPSFKSTFTITLVHRRNHTALSNMPSESTLSLGSELVETKFRKSVPMVTYLACFIVCDFAYKEKATTRGTPFRVYAPPDKIDQVDYSLDIGVRVLEKYEDIFGLPYPLPKLDQIAIPDFIAGAMENWGLVTYRETNLLFNSTEASASNKQRVATVVAHELAHMWFGNLVTMKWWDDLWLNEGFASYVEYLGVHHVHPDWDMDAHFLVDDMFPVMEVDSAISSHPIVVPVSHPNQITEVFDSISYSKGASVLRMLGTFLGENNFKQGLQEYMKLHEYATTVTDDLWNALSKVDGAPNVKSVMDTWTRQMGYPVVHVSVVGQELRLRQERFLLDTKRDKTQPSSPYNYQWKIPVRCVTSKGNITNLIWFNDRQASVKLSFSFSSSDWIKCNVNETGYYRVNYVDDNWKALALQVHSPLLTANDRVGLIDNAFSIAQAGLIPYGVPLSLSLNVAKRELHYAPWRALEINVHYINSMLMYTVHYGAWQAYMRQLVNPAFERFGLRDSGSHIESLTRSTIINLACTNGIVVCLNNASNMFRDWLQSGRYVAPDLRDTVYKFGMQEIGNEDVWDLVWQRYLNTTIPQEKNRLLRALTQTRIVWLLNRLLEYSADETKVRAQDFFTLIAYMSTNPAGRPLVWTWVQVHWPRLVKRFTISHRGLGRMVPGIVNSFNTPFQLEEVENFFKKYPEAGAGERGRSQALESIRTNIEWSKSGPEQIANWFHNNIQL
jgi:glutamyl aminopeptidase